MRRKCQECRLKKCLAVGMRPECVVPENQCAMKRREKKAQKEKDKIQTSVCATEIKKEILDLMTCEPPTHPTCPVSLIKKHMILSQKKKITFLFVSVSFIYSCYLMIFWLNVKHVIYRLYRTISWQSYIN